MTEIAGIPEPAGARDGLTGLGGPDAWQRALVVEIARTERYRRPLCVVLIDLLGALEVGEELGARAGRHALRTAAGALRRESRTSDLLFRIGPARFGAVLPETDEVAAINYIERVRDGVASRLPSGGAGMRLAFGWASPRPGESPDTVVRRADHRMLGEQRP